VVVYDAGDGALAAARAWFLLRALGHERVAVLDGGWARWTVLGLPVDDAMPSPEATRYEGIFDHRRLVDSDAVQAHLTAGGVLLDARARERFRGDMEPIDSVAGHVPGALNRPYADNLRNGQFKSAQELLNEFGQLLGAHNPEDVVAMCGSGVTACHHLLAMEHAGLHGAKLYAGSWSGWISDPNREIAIGD
jgi:thiosulfate/3-mercaptopyruvate sulfurtransferase